MKKIHKYLMAICLFIIAANLTMATNKYAVATGNWSSTSTWSLSRGGASGAAVPASTDSVFIPSPYTVTVDASGKLVKDLIVESGATLKSNSSTLGTPVYIRVYNSITNSGTIGSATDALGFQAYGSAVSINGTGSTSFDRMSTAVASTVTFNTNVSVYYPSGSAVYANGSAAVFTINANDTLKFLGSGSYFAVGTSGSNVPSTGATMTINVYGSVFMSSTATQINLQNTSTNVSTLHVYNGGTVNTNHDILGNTSGTPSVVTVDQGGAINFLGVSRNCSLGISTTTVNGTIDFGPSATSGRTLGTATVGSTGKIRLSDATLPSGITLSTGSTVEYYTASTPASITLPTGYTTYSNLTVTNSSGVALAANTTVKGILKLQGGNLTTGSSYTLTVDTAGSVTRTTGWVVGNLAKTILAASPSATYEIGDASNYAPVNLTFNGVSVAGTVTAKTTLGEHPQILNASGLSSSSDVNRYWTLTNNGVTCTSYSATFNFNSGDIDAGADYTQFLVSNYASSVWTSQTVGTKTSTSTQITGATLFGDFAVGDVYNTNPAISIGGTLSSFGLVLVSTTSAAEKSFTVSAVNLTDTLTIKPPTGVLISQTSGTEASTPITLTPVSGTISPAVTIYVKFAPTAVGSFSSNIAVTSPGSTYQYVSVTGFGEATEPTSASTNLVFSNVTSTSMKLTWTKGNGTNHLVIARASNAVSANPSDGTSYTANATYASGSLVTSGYVVYSGSDSTFTMTGLTDATLYYFAVYEYNGTAGSGSENYLTSSTLTGVRGANVVQSNTGTFTGNWSAASTWIGGLVPTASDNVKIGSTAVITIDSANAVCNTLSFASSTGAKLVFNSNAVLTVYGDLVFYSQSSNHVNSWAAGGKLKFAGSATQTIKNLTTTASSTSSTPLYEVIVDKTGGKVTTEGTDNKIMLVRSLEIVNGLFQLNTADDIQGWDNTSATTPTITVDAGGTFDMYGGGANSIRSGTSGSAPIGKLTIAGSVTSFVTTSTLGLSPGGIDILSGGILYIPSGWTGGSQGLHGGAIHIYSGGILSHSTTSNVWDATCVVTLDDGGIFRASATTTVFPTSFTNNGTVLYTRTTAGADQIITDMDYKNLEIKDNGCNKAWTLSAGRTISGNLTIDSAAVCNVTLGANDLTLNGTLSKATAATISVDASGAGQLKKSFTSTPSSFTFPISAGGVYSPVSVDLTSGTLSSAYIGAKVSATKSSHNTSTTNYINRTWTLSGTGITSPVYSDTLTYAAGDVAGTEASLYGGLYNGSAWSSLGAVNATSHYIVGSGLTSFGEITAGEASAMGVASSGHVAVTVIPQGYYNAGDYLNSVDTVSVLLADASTYVTVDSTTVVLDSVTFTGTATFATATSGNYYLVVKQRSSVETWSASTVAFAQGSTISYNFTDAQNKAYGDNQVQVSSSPERWAIYGGDCNQDGYVDPLDMSLIDQDSFNYVSGTGLATDVNGDHFVDPLDMSIADQNSFNYVGIKRPVTAKQVNVHVRPKIGVMHYKGLLKTQK